MVWIMEAVRRADKEGVQVSSFSQQNRDGAKLHQAMKAAEKDKRPAGSWWLGKDRAAFQAEVKARHQCILNSRNPSDRSLNKAI